MNLYKRYAITAVILILGAAISLLYTPATVRGVKNIGLIPEELDGWRFIGDIEMDPAVIRVLDPAGLLFREYTANNSLPLDVVVVYHQNNRWGAHAPIVCYTSQGWDLIKEPSKRIISIDGQEFTINQFEVKKGQLQRLVYYYWFSSNKKITADRTGQMFDMVINGLLYGYTESGFVRISMPVTEADQKEIRRQMDDFTVKFTSTLEKYI